MEGTAKRMVRLRIRGHATCGRGAYAVDQRNQRGRAAGKRNCAGAAQKSTLGGWR